MSLSWLPLPKIETANLVSARLQMHWAAQVVASIGYSYVEALPDWSHLSLEWIDGRFVTHQATEFGFCASLEPTSLTLGFYDIEGRLLDEQPLNGYSIEEAYGWLAGAIRSHTKNKASDLVRPDHDMPEHGISGGDNFEISFDEFDALASWYHNAAMTFDQMSDVHEDAGEVLCWPHHFDIATLIRLDPESDDESGRSIGVGMSPGDTSYPDPYWYVMPWPRPESATLLPSLEVGSWHTEGWSGAVLTSAETLAADNQQAVVSEFFEGGISACRQFLGS